MMGGFNTQAETGDKTTTIENRRARARFEWGDFTAFSYMWGDPNSTRDILVNGIEVTIGANLESALRTL